MNDLVLTRTFKHPSLGRNPYKASYKRNFTSLPEVRANI